MVKKSYFSEEEQTEENNKILCAVRNPSERRYQSWFYNIFLKNLKQYNNQSKRNHTKVNWVMKLTKEEINILKNKTCKIINLENLINNNNNKKEVLDGD